MKKILKKALSVFLAALMCLMVAPAFALASDEQTTPAAPVFALELKEETADSVILVLKLKENSFNCLDVAITACDDCTNLTLTNIEFNIDIFLTGGSGSFNVANGMISFARTESFTAEYEVATYTFEKADDIGVSADNFDIDLISCGISSGNDAESTIDLTETTVINNNVPAVHTHEADGDWDIITDPTCAESGEQVRYCGICGEIAESEEIEATGHQDTTTEYKAPTCAEPGYEKVICNDCGATVSETEIEATGHQNTTTEHKDPTCTQPGYDKVTCLDCGVLVSETPINPIGQGETKTERLSPTCTEDGYIKEICTICNEQVSETTLPSAGHRYIQDIKNATCTEDGHIQNICPACGDVSSFVALPHTGHYWLDWEIIKQPTYSKEGVERRICNTCGVDEERAVPKLVATPTELVMSMQEIGMNFRQTTRLFVNVLPEEAAYSTEIIWESSDPSVVTVDEEGTVYAAGLGTATITARTADGSLAATCEVTVEYSILQWIIVYILFGWIWYL